MTANMLRSALAYKLRDPDVPRWERNQERTHSRLLAEKVVDHWPWSVPYPSTPRQIEAVAVRVKAETFRIEKVAEIAVAVQLGQIPPGSVHRT